MDSEFPGCDCCIHSRTSEPQCLCWRGADSDGPDRDCPFHGEMLRLLDSMPKIDVIEESNHGKSSTEE